MGVARGFFKYSRTSIIRTRTGPKKTFELWKVRIMEVDSIGIQPRRDQQISSNYRKFELQGFELWRFDCISSADTKDGNGTLLYFIISRSRKIETEHYHIISSAEFERRKRNIIISSAEVIGSLAQ